MAPAEPAGPVMALPDPGHQQQVVRENVPDPLAGEQTWPTEEVRLFTPCMLCGCMQAVQQTRCLQQSRLEGG